MSFASLLNSAPKQRVKLKGASTQGHVQVPNEKIVVDKYTPSIGKGSEYAAKYRAEEEKSYQEAFAIVNERLPEDVTEAGTSKMCQPEELTSIGTIPNLMELNREELTQVYDNYNFTPTEPSENLQPIHDEKEQILRLIENNQVCIIKGPTGCGKSTQIPQFILDSYVKRRAHCNIIVTQPRRIAAITIAQHICEERKWAVGGIVGYQVALDKQCDTDTRILYCTTGVFLEKLISAKHLNDYTHIFLDEVHEREEDMDFAMLIVRKFLRNNSPKVKVILMSATMDVTRFANYFEVSLRNEKQPAPYYEIQRENTFIVQVHYLDALKTIGQLPIVSEDKPEIAKEAYHLIPIMLRAFNPIDVADYKSGRCHEEKGAVLIFLPGLYQIETLFEILQNEDQRDPTNLGLWLCPLHSSITRDEQEKVRRYAPQGRRKVILSTNIAESSITIPDVKYVIDFCLTKHLVADTVTGFSSLQLAWASHTNCIQREGRVGRVQDGRVYRLVPKTFYQGIMMRENVPEMQRCPLEIIVLKSKRLMENECPLRLISSALDPPDLDNYEKTILKLKEIGALLRTTRGVYNELDGDLTFVGRVMSSLPLDIHITKLILLGHIFDVLEEAIIMGCAMSVRNIFSEPFQRRLDAYNNKLLWADSSESDAIAYLNAYMIWRQLTGIGKFNRSVSSEDAWSRRYMLQIKQLKEMAKQEQDIKNRLRNFNIQMVRQKGKPLWTSMEKPLILKLVLAGAFYPHYYLRRSENPNAESDAVKMLAGHNPYHCVYLQNMPHPAPLYLDQVRDSLQRMGVSEDVQLHHDDTRKLVVSFNIGEHATEQLIGERNFHMNIPGEIVMPVYRAIKLRQLNMPITIKTLPPNSAREALNKLNRQNSSNSNISLAPSEFKPLIGLHQQIIEIEVCHVKNAGEFYAHIQPSKETLLHIFSILNIADTLQPVERNIQYDVIYAAPYKDDEDGDMLFYRAKVQEKYYLQNVPWVSVFFIDYGNCSRVPAYELREIRDHILKKELDEIPPAALKCRLAEVSANYWSNHQGEWCDPANNYVTRLLLNKIWCAKVYSYINGVAFVYLYISDNYKPSDKAPNTLNEELIKKGYAQNKEESYFSKVNRARRAEIEEKGDYNLSSLSIEEESESVVKSLKLDLMSLPTTSCRSIVDLKGPNSPLEMKLSSMVHSSTQRDVKVEWNSVNSVLLDSDPSDPHERLLVAGSVSQSSDGRKLTLNHTTVLPNMHGLAALVFLIFAPSIELRTDSVFSRYTGAICGLGMKNNGVSLFPENDIEIQFDVEFTKQDLINVNKLRYWMNERYCTDDAADMPDSYTITLQNHVRHFAFSLLKPVRRSVKKYYNQHPFLWGLVPEYRKCLPVEETANMDFSHQIYPLHGGIDIEPENDRKIIEQLVYQLENLEKSLASGLAPRENYCVLCEVHFDYVNMLRLHMSATYHKALVEWLMSRAEAHGITMGKQSTTT